jgi:hypothetical protein
VTGSRDGDGLCGLWELLELLELWNWICWLDECAWRGQSHRLALRKVKVVYRGEGETVDAPCPGIESGWEGGREDGGHGGHGGRK